jgi:hypothetical protein
MELKNADDDFREFYSQIRDVFHYNQKVNSYSEEEGVLFYDTEQLAEVSEESELDEALAEFELEEEDSFLLVESSEDSEAVANVARMFGNDIIGRLESRGYTVSGSRGRDKVERRNSF